MISDAQISVSWHAEAHGREEKPTLLKECPRTFKELEMTWKNLALFELHCVKRFCEGSLGLSKITEFPKRVCQILEGCFQFKFLFLILLLTIPQFSNADTMDEFILSKNAFDAGEYEKAANRFEELLKSEIKNKALVLECHKFSAVSYLFIEDKNAAHRHFTELLLLEPTYELDSMLFPVSVLDFFTRIKKENTERFKALEEAQKKEKEKELELERRKRAIQISKLRRNVYVKHEIHRNSMLVALMPFGAGQFQNRQKKKGIFFMSAELFTGLSTITTFILHARLQNTSEIPFEDSEKRKYYEKVEKAYRITNRTSFITLMCLMTWGIIDSLVNFNKETNLWKSVNEKDVPKYLHPPKIAPLPDDTAAISWTTKF